MFEKKERKTIIANAINIYYRSFFTNEKYFFFQISPQLFDLSLWFFACGLKQNSLNWKPKMGFVR